MIVKLNPDDQEEAEKILKVQIPAYEVEAELINFHGIPQLKDTVQTIKNSKETFLGYILQGELAGFIAYTLDCAEIDICRLVVHPSHFRKGIARKLAGHVISQAANNHQKLLVSTGSKNLPAKSLYHSLGFMEVKELEVSPGIYISLMELDTLGNTNIKK
ncbi:GNAT family N-acetyltransferase [Peribacillus glennii]|uniref:GNAT family N-acetyltransferase n=1 Tax=Peribacillus glennii TaxID=2303991 RepID=A0A372L918_9BACI|nr:GNAT family N-acetyltransferase [Peribacillus glennii]RFU62005.1 GNAT family N-acetyltransferase [Peribacillus glennii]